MSEYMILLYTVKQKNTNAFTLLELLMVIALISLLAIATLMLLNPMNIYNHALDTRKKADLSKFKKALEEYYTDKSCYPPPVKVCYSGADNPNLFGTTCYICGTEPGTPSLAPYLDELPCDPNHSKMKYFYVVDNAACPKKYKIYAKFNVDEDIDSIKVGCAMSGCGPTPGSTTGYDYGESSPNVSLDTARYYYCLTTGDPKTCDNCGTTYDQCVDNPNGACGDIYSSKADCDAVRLQ